MVDVRERVNQDRNPLSQIRAIIPGFTGYFKREDLRAADNMLRMQVAERLAGVRKDAEGCRSVMAFNNALDYLERLGMLISKFKAVESEVSHAAQGYSGIMAKVSIGDEELNKLYEYDYALLASVEDMKADASKLIASVDANDAAGIKASIEALRSKLDAFEGTFRLRMSMVTNTGA